MTSHTRFTFSYTFAALKHKNYQYWFAGQLVSLVGTWMQTTAQGFLVFSLTNSPAYLGIVAFANGIAAWLFTLYGGVISDRMSRRTLLLITQSAMMILAFGLAALVFTNLVQPWHIVVMSFLLGVANAFDAPTRLAFVAELVEREDLTNAIALNALMFNGAAIVGPTAAGLAYAWFGPGWCFTINGISFIAVIIALSFMRLAPFVPKESNDSTFTKLKEGLVYVAHHDTIRMIIFNVGILSMFAMGIVALIPAWAVNVLHGDAATNGLLLAVRGVGALVSAIMIASLSRYQIKGRLWTIGSVVTPVSLFVFALLHWLPASLLAMMVMGWSFMLMINTSNALVQSHVEDQLRGRVMSIYTLIFFGMMPIGSLILGILADLWNEPLVAIISAGVLALFALFTWFLRPHLRALE